MKLQFKTKIIEKKVRKILLAILLLMVFTPFIQAQERGVKEFAVNFGDLTSNNFLDVFSDIATSAITLGIVKSDNTKYSPSFGVTYKYAFKNKWMIFIDGSYQSANEDIYVQKNKIGERDLQYFTAGIGSDYHYVSNEVLQVYSGASIAYTFSNEKYSKTTYDFKNNNQNFLNFQLNAIGLRVGKKLAASLELGFGYKGILNAGISYQF